MKQTTQKVNPKLLLLLIVGMIILAGVACQSGEVITPAEATTRAKAARAVKVKKTATPGGKTASGGDVLANGTKAKLVGKAFLVNIYKEAGSTRILTQQEKGIEVEIQDTQSVDGVSWYLVSAPAGQGWVKAENLEVPETAKDEDAPKSGDTVYLQGKAYLVNLYKEPGSMRIIAQQERGVSVTIQDVQEVKGATWYLIDAPTGLGWVKADSITTEKP